MTDFSCNLYRMFDDADQLLYIGVTRHLIRRKSKHKKSKPWYGDVVRITCEPFTSRIVAEDAELDAIQTENPRYNIAGKTRPFTQSCDAMFERWERGQPERERHYEELCLKMRESIAACNAAVELEAQSKEG